MKLTYRYRVKSLNGQLNRYARAVNYVWNYCNDAQKHAVKWGQRWPSGFELTYQTAGSGKIMGISATTVSEVCRQYAQSRNEKRKAWLRYRGRKSLGWVPVRAEAIRVVDGGFRYYGDVYKVFLSRPIPDNAKIKDGSSFSQDAKGNWYLNVVIEVPNAESRSPTRS
jgi:putative transposase